MLESLFLCLQVAMETSNNPMWSHVLLSLSVSKSWTHAQLPIMQVIAARSNYLGFEHELNFKC